MALPQAPSIPPGVLFSHAPCRAHHPKSHEALPWALLSVNSGEKSLPPRTRVIPNSPSSDNGTDPAPGPTATFQRLWGGAVWSGLACVTAPHHRSRQKASMGPGTCPFPPCPEAPTSSPRARATQGPVWSLGSPRGPHSALPPCPRLPLSGVGLPQPPAPHLSSAATDGSTVHTHLFAASLPPRPRRKFNLLCGIASPWWSADHPCPATEACGPSHPCPKPGVQAFPVLLSGISRSAPGPHDRSVLAPEYSCTHVCYRHAPWTLVTPSHWYVPMATHTQVGGRAGI